MPDDAAAATGSFGGVDPALRPFEGRSVISGLVCIISSCQVFVVGGPTHGPELLVRNRQACLNQVVNLRAAAGGVCSIARLQEETQFERVPIQAGFPSSTRALATSARQLLRLGID
jgi:hypothetical protein